MKTSPLLIIPIAVIAFALTGCAGPASVADDTSQGIPDSVEVGDDFGAEGPSAFWIDHGGSFGIVTWGSSSCPPVPTEIAGDADVLTVLFEQSGQEACTADMAATTHTFTVPPEMTETPTSVELHYVDSPEVTVLPLD